MQEMDLAILASGTFMLEVNLLRPYKLPCDQENEGLRIHANLDCRFTFFTNWTFLLFGLWSVLGIALTAYSIQVVSLLILVPRLTVRAVVYIVS